MTVSLKPTWTSIASRFAIAAFVSALLGLLLYGLQLTIEELKGSSLRKYGLVLLLIYGSGFAWDTVKHLITLPEAQYLRFRGRVARSLAWFFGYTIAGTVFQLLLGVWAGPWTITSIAWLVAAAACGYLAIRDMGVALDYALELKTPQAESGGA